MCKTYLTFSWNSFFSCHASNFRHHMFVWHASIPCEQYLLQDPDTSWTFPYQGISFIYDHKMLKKFNDVMHSWLDKNFLLTNWPSLSKDKKKKESETTYPCFVVNSRETSGLLKIAKLLENSGVCGIPTDTVYALAVSCKNPSAIEKIYSIKVLASRQAMIHNILLQIIKYLCSLSADPHTFISARIVLQRSQFASASQVWSSLWLPNLLSVPCYGSSWEMSTPEASVALSPRAIGSSNSVRLLTRYSILYLHPTLLSNLGQPPNQMKTLLSEICDSLSVPVILTGHIVHRCGSCIWPCGDQR